MNSLPCNIALLPNPSLENLAVSASQKLQKFDSLFTLEDGRYFPHVSLYMFQLKTEELTKVEGLLAAIAQSMTPLRLQAYRYDHTMCFVDAEYEKSPELVGLQEAVIKAVNPIRDGMREKSKERMKEAEGLALKNFQNYGYQYVGELFRPHLTITRLRAENPEALKALGDLSQYSGAFWKIGLFAMGDHGTATRKLADFELLGSGVAR